MHLLKSKIFSPKRYKQIDEPMISNNIASFIQKTRRGSKITVYNTMTGEIRSVSMENLLCFNAHDGGGRMAFEFSGSSRGMGILYLEKLSVRRIDNIKPGAVLSGIWNDALVLRCGNNIVLHDVATGEEDNVLSCRNIIGMPVSRCGICAWLQDVGGNHCINIWRLNEMRNLVFIPHGLVNSIYVQEGFVIYRCFKENRHWIFAYDISTGMLTRLCDSADWIELYPGDSGTIAWTVRRSCECSYTFDLFTGSIRGGTPHEVVSNSKNTIIPASSGDLIIWVESCIEGDNIFSANV